MSLGLFGDEAFYVQCSQRPDWAYMDLPFVTAMLVRLGTELVGHSQLGVRIVFVALGALLPFLVVRLAWPHVGPNHARAAGLWALILPGFAWQGFMALPDGPLLICLLVCLIALEQAITTQKWSWWFVCGFVCGVGFCTHYRFVLATLGIAVWFLISRDGRTQLRTPKPWMGGLLALIGTGPALYYNLAHNFSPLRYFLSVRNGLIFQPGELIAYVLKQAALMTPLAYGLLLLTLLFMWHESSAGNEKVRLYFIVSVTPIVCFFLASPFSRTGAHMMHWPLPGYVPLLVYLPVVCLRYWNKGGWLRRFTTASPMLAMLVTCILLIAIRLPIPGLDGLRHPYQGWSELAEKTQAHLQQMSSERPLLVADHYKTGAQLEFAFGGETVVYIMRHSKNFEHGRQDQFELWAIGERALMQTSNNTVLLVVELSEIPRGFESNWWKHLDFFFKDRVLLEAWDYAPRKSNPTRQFLFFRARLFYDG